MRVQGDSGKVKVIDYLYYNYVRVHVSVTVE